MKLVVTALALSVAFLAPLSRAQDASQADCNAPASQPLRYIHLPGRPFATVLTPDGCWLFTSVMPAPPTYINGIVVLRRHGNEDIAVERVVPIGGRALGMVMTHDGRLLVACAGDFVAFLDVERLIQGRSNPILAYISDGSGAATTYVNITSDDKFLFVSNEGTSSISVINLEIARQNGFRKESVVGKIPVGYKPIALTFSKDEKLLYTTSEVALESWGWPARCKLENARSVDSGSVRPEGAILIVDVQKAEVRPEFAVISKISAGCSPVRIALSADSETIWVTVRNNNAVEGFDASKLVDDQENARIAWVPVGSSPVGIIRIPGKPYALVANSNRFAADAFRPQFLYLIDLMHPSSKGSSEAILGQIEAGAFPREFGRSLDGKTIFLSNYLSENVEIIDSEHLPIQPIGISRDGLRRVESALFHH